MAGCVGDGGSGSGPERADTASLRAADSTRFAWLIGRGDSLTDGQVIEAATIRARRDLAWPDDAVRVRHARLMVDSAERLVARRRRDPELVGLAAKADGILAALDDSLPRALDRRRDRLRTQTVELVRRDERRLRAEARKLWAELWEGRMRREGIDVQVTVTGRENTRLTLRSILVSRAFADRLTEDGTLLREMGEGGFTRFTITDGYGATWYWDLDD